MAKVTITLGNRCELSIVDDGHLILSQRSETESMSAQIDLGLATESCFENLISYISRLSVHAVDSMEETS